MQIENANKVYNSSGHVVYSCQYHVIFCPKYRRAVLKEPYDQILKNIFLDVAKEYNFSILDMEVMPDHVHLIIDCNPAFGITNCVKKLKATSSHILRRDYHYFKTILPTLWTRSYFVSTVGAVSIDVVKQYIANQKGK